MNKCPGCGVRLSPQITHCPVCGKFIHEATAPEPESYPAPRARLRPSQLVSNLDRGMWVAVLVVVAVNLFLNWGEWTRQAMWSMYAVASAIFLHFSVYRPLHLKVFYWVEAVLQILFGLAYFLFWDWATDGVITWSVTWLMPIVFGALALTACIWLSIRRRDPGNLLLLSMTTFICSLVLWLLGEFLFENMIAGYTVIPSFTAFLLSTGVFVFFGAFRFRALKAMLKKRFHL